jgi:transposase-like protein
MLSKWRDRYQVANPDTDEASLEPSDLEAAKREIKRLRRQLAYVEEEREILKKTINIFSRRSE